MKRVVFFTFLIVSIGFVSCKKCITCQLKAGEVYETYEEEFCGSKSERENFEKEYQEKAQASAVTGVRAVCTTD